MVGVMSTVWKVLVGLALVVPMAAYVAGSLAASASDDPAPRHTITIREAPPTRSASPTPSPTPSQSSEPEVITPSYDALDDDHGGDHHGGDDHSGSDNGGSDNGGSDNGGSDDHSGDDHSGHGRGGGED